jgi:hypothetical protein
MQGGVSKALDGLIKEEEVRQTTVTAIARRNTSQKISIRFGETIKAYLTRPSLKVSELKLIPLALAAWLRYLLGIDDQGQPFTVSPDPLYETLSNTTLPRWYSRGFHVQGTRALFCEDNRSLFLEGEHNKFEFRSRDLWGNAETYLKSYKHPIWQKYLEAGVKGGHDGMDWLEFDAFFEVSVGNRRTRRC